MAYTNSRSTHLCHKIDCHRYTLCAILHCPASPNLNFKAKFGFINEGSRYDINIPYIRCFMDVLKQEFQ